MAVFEAGDTPSVVYTKVLENAPKGYREFIEREGKSAIDKLRLVGLYDDRQYGYFMLRTRIAGGFLTSKQARVIGEAAEEFSRRPQGDEEDEERFIEITTRQDIQIHWIRIEDIPEIWKRYSGAGLTSFQACGSTTRNVTSCPLAGLDSDEVFDARPAVREVTDFLLSNPSISSFLPRKFKISISGCREDCTLARINDLSFTPARKDDGKRGFHAWVGGGLSDYPRLASQIDGFISADQTIDFVRACLEVYMKFGDYKHTAINRFRALVESMGVDKVSEEIRRRLSFTLEEKGEDLADTSGNDHIGVRRQKQEGLFYAGLNVLVGRMNGRDLSELAELADRYGSGELRLTQRQNVILVNVQENSLPSLLGEPLLKKLSPDPKPFERGFVACTGAPFCKFGLVNSKEVARRIQRFLDGAFAERYGKRVPIRVHLSACAASCAQPQIADIGLRANTHLSDASLEEAFDIGIGGNLAKGSLIKWVRFAVPSQEVYVILQKLMDDYLKSATPSTTFCDYVDGLVAERQIENIFGGGEK